MMIPSDNNKLNLEVNIVPIIDCFTVLITFLLISVSFLSLGYFQVRPQIVSTNQKNYESPLEIYAEIMLMDENQINVNLVNGSNTHLVYISSQNSNWDHSKLEKTLINFKEQFPQLNQVSIQAVSTVHYEDLIAVLEKIEPLKVSVLLGGFES
jgi:biopolymer transport protein ExbD